MSPRKSHDGHVPRWRYKSHRREVKAILEGPYNCPKCGKKELGIEINRADKMVKAKCNCGLSRDLIFKPQYQPVDYYGKIIDHFYNRESVLAED